MRKMCLIPVSRSTKPSFTCSSADTESACNVGDLGLIPSRRSGWEDPLEKGMATHSRILAWRIPWTVQSMGWQRIGHNWAAITFKPDPGDTAALINGVGEDRVVLGTFQKSKTLWLLEYKVQQMGKKKKKEVQLMAIVQS